MSSDETLPGRPQSADGREEASQASDLKRKRAVFKAASDRYNADIYLYSGEIGNDGYGKLVGSLVGPPKSARPNALLILTTNGGSGNSAYQIARLLQKTYRKFFLYAPSYCKSAGTIVALGAHRLILDVFSELGPIDVQLPSRDELWEQRSGLISKSAFKSLTEASFDMYQQFMLSIKYASKNQVSFRLASDVSTSLTSQLMGPIYSQINPDNIGSDFRDLDVATEYGKRLAAGSKNASASAVQHLVTNYPSHDFIIDDDEARKLFRNVDPPAPELYQLVEQIGDVAFNEAKSPTVCFVGDEYDDSNKVPAQDRRGNDPEDRAAGSGVARDSPGDQPGNTEARSGSAGAKEPARKRKNGPEPQTDRNA